MTFWTGCATCIVGHDDKKRLFKSRKSVSRQTGEPVIGFSRVWPFPRFSGSPVPRLTGSPACPFASIGLKFPLGIYKKVRAVPGISRNELRGRRGRKGVTGVPCLLSAAQNPRHRANVITCQIYNASKAAGEPGGCPARETAAASALTARPH